MGFKKPQNFINIRITSTLKDETQQDSTVGPGNVLVIELKWNTTPHQNDF